MSFEQLPSELLDMVMRQLARSPLPLNRYTWHRGTPTGFGSIYNARLVCRAWNRAASAHQFRTIRLQFQKCPPSNPEKDGNENERAVFARWHKTLDLDVARHSARHVIIDSTFRGEQYWHSDAWRDWRRNPNAEFRWFDDALGRIAQLPNLEAVEVHFHDNVAGEISERAHWKGDHEPRIARQNTLKAVFRAIHTRKQKSLEDGDGSHASTITHLSIKNLQNVTDREFEASDLFQSVIEDIRHFHLHIATECNEHGPDMDLEMIERRTFEPQLQAGLLSSVSSQLTTLTLSFNEEWGTMPGYFDGAGLEFPNLRTLHLHLLAISHDNHLDWVLRIPQLTSLCLCDTRIMSYAHIPQRFVDEWNIRAHDWKQVPTEIFGFEDDHPVFTYATRWSYFFDRIRSELSKLRDFRISWPRETWIDGTRAPWTEVPKPDTEPEAWLSRYMTFDGSLCLSPWSYSESDGIFDDFGCYDEDGSVYEDYSSPPYKQRGGYTLSPAKLYDSEDEKAYRELLKATWARR